jgi:hypothetical protein
MVLLADLTHMVAIEAYPCQQDGLKDFVDHIYYVHPFPHQMQRPSVFDFRPSPSVILHFQHFAQPDDGEQHPYQSKLTGPHLNHVPWQIPAGYQSWIIVFKPHGWYHYTGHSPLPIVSRSCYANHFFDKTALQELHSFLQNTTNADTAMTYLAEWLLKNRRVPKQKIKPEFAEVVENMVASEGLNRVEHFLNEKVKIRSLERYFKKAVGLSPKLLLEILRYQKVLKLQETHLALNWNQESFKDYYYDQSHFQRDISRFRKPGVLPLVEPGVEIA